MASFEGFWAEFRRNGLPHWPENRIIIAFVVVGALALSFDDTVILGAYKTVPTYQPIVLLFALVGSAVAVYTNVLVQKAFALRRGLKTTANWTPIKLALALLVGIFTFSRFPIVFSPDLDARLQPFQRVGKWRYDVNLKDYAKMGAAGMFANVAVAGFVAAISGMHDPLSRAIVIASAFSAVGTIVPIPRSPGFFLLFVSTVYYALALGLAAVGVIIAYTSAVWLGVSFGLVATVLFWAFVIVKVDKIIDFD